MEAVSGNSKRGLKTGIALVIEFSLTALPLFTLFFFFFPSVALFMNQTADWIFIKLIPQSQNQILFIPFFHRQISYLSCSGGETTTQLKLIWAGLSGAVIFATSKINCEIPYKFIIYFLSFVIFATSLILLLFPQAFPYTIASFAEITMKLEVLFWFIFPLMLGSLLLQVNIPLLRKITFMVCLMALTLLLSILKYTFSLYIIAKGSYIFTPLMFFIFGPYMNLVYVVAFFAFFTSRFKK